MNPEKIIVKCNNCGTKNRVAKNRLNARPVCGHCKSPLKLNNVNIHPIDVTDQDFSREVLSHSGPVLVDCWAAWCGPCKMVAPILDQLASEFAGQIKIVKLNVDQNPTTASNYGIQSIPTLLLFNNGTQVDRAVGALPKNEIERFIRKVI